ncbi:hypothetical protein [Vibrio parahaemolyticus]|uniref:hypothetical protein n=1 Tax=Vibrio parahaemolyticus TaxID=670 RepID=UPI001E461CD3|nr:hypothetical protein [Vibrio parahaemolyticus]
MFRIFKGRDSKSFKDKVTKTKSISSLPKRIFKAIGKGFLRTTIILAVMFLSLGLYAHANGFFAANDYNYTFEAYQKLISGEFEMHTSVSSALADQYALHNSFAVYFSYSIVGVALLWFIFQWIVSTKTKSVNSSNHAMKIILCLSAAAFLNTPVVETKTPNGLVYKKPLITVMFESLVGDVLTQAGEMSERDYGQLVEIPEIKLAPELAYYDSFREFSVLMLKTDFVEGIEHQIKVYEESGEYYMRFKMGSKYLKFRLASNEDLNAKAYNIGVDLKTLEKEYVIAYFTDLVNHSISVRNALNGVNVVSNSTISKGFLGSNDFDQISNYSMDYKKYCDSIYDAVPERLNEYGVNEYIEVAAKCASKNHISKHYQNPFYDYETVMFTNTELKRGFVANFGNNRQSLKMNVDTLIVKTQQMCSSGSYLACAPSITIAAYEDKVRNLKLDIFTPIVRMFAPLTFSMNDSYNLQTSRKIEGEIVLSTDFEDYSSYYAKSEPISTIPFTPIAAQRMQQDLDGIFNYIDLDMIDLSKIDQELVVKTLIGIDTKEVWGRLTTCSFNPSQIKDGYRCMRPTVELSNAAIGFGQIAVRAYLLATVNTSDGYDQNVFKTNKNMFGGKVNLLKTSAIGYATNEPFIDSPYYAADTMNNMIIAKIIIEMVNPNNVASEMIAEIFYTIAKVFGFVSVSIFLFVYAIPTIYFKHLFMSLQELLVHQIIAPLSVAVWSVNADPLHVFKELVKACLKFLTFVAVCVMGFHYMDLILMAVIEQMLEYQVMEWQGITHFIAVYTSKLLSFVLSAFVILKSLRKELDEVNEMSNVN